MFRYSDWLISFPVLRWVNRKLDRFFTTGGKVVFAATFFFAAGSTHLDSPVYLLCAATITVLFLAFASSYYFRPTLTHQFRAPGYLFVGQSANVELKVQNIGTNDAYFDLWSAPTANSDVFVDIDSSNPPAILGLPASATQIAAIPVRAMARGIHQCPDLWARSAFPLDLMHIRQKISSAVQLVAVPMFKPLRSAKFITAFESTLAGNNGHSSMSGNRDFTGSREYVPGTPVRRWDYAAWARHGSPFVRQFDDDARHSATLVFDPSQSENDSTRFDAAISLTLSIAEELTQRHYQLNSLVIGKQRIDLTPVAEESRFHEICVQLAAVSRDPNNEIELAELIGIKDHLVVVVSSCSADKIRENSAHLQIENHQCFCIQVHDPRTPVSTTFNAAVPTTEIEMGEVAL